LESAGLETVGVAVEVGSALIAGGSDVRFAFEKHGGVYEDFGAPLLRSGLLQMNLYTTTPSAVNSIADAVNRCPVLKGVTDLCFNRG
jgi:hypothetical protein